MHRSILLLIVMLFISVFGYSQNNADAYMANPGLALRDARTSFENGDYEKAIKLITVYQSLSGKNDGADLLSKAQQCQQYVEEAKLFEAQGDEWSASQCYMGIIGLNPNDTSAKNKIISFDEIRSYNLGIACVRKGNKWGAIDEKKNIIIPIVYDKIWDFWPFNPKQITTPAIKNGKMGFVNKYGEEVTPFIYNGIRGIELDTPNIYFLVYKINSQEVYVDMNGVEYPTEDEAAYGILGLRKNDTKTTGPYKVGDFYNENGCKGVVFDVDDTGMKGKIVSLMNGYEYWVKEDSRYSTTQLGLLDENDGEYNFNIIKKINNWSNLFPAFEWCNKIGEGWYLPANNELLLIEKNINLINDGVRIAGYRPLVIVNVVSSTEVKSEPDKVYYIYYGEFQPLDKKYDYHLLAVKKFGYRLVTGEAYTGRVVRCR